MISGFRAVKKMSLFATMAIAACERKVKESQYYELLKEKHL